MNGFLSIIRGCQDIIGHADPRRRVRAPPDARRSSASRPTPAGCRTTCTAWTTPTSATATGCPPGQTLSKLPSEYFRENIYTTFQDDWVAFKTADLMNWHRLMWANDFPHSDSTWPWSQEMLAEHQRRPHAGAARRHPVRQRRRALRDRRRGARGMMVPTSRRHRPEVRRRCSEGARHRPGVRRE